MSGVVLAMANGQVGTARTNHIDMLADLDDEERDRMVAHVHTAAQKEGEDADFLPVVNVSGAKPHLSPADLSYVP